MTTTLPVGVFDSGVGGLTVLAAIQARLPGEDLLYLGDTARLPYGAKSPETVTRYALQASAKLVERGVKMLVVACNTASAVALGALERQYPDLPVVGVVEPGARASCETSERGDIVVLATESTTRGGAYVRAIHAIRPEARVRGLACAMFVALAEEGWADGDIARSVAARYLDPVFSGRDRPDCVVLGCTHFPLLADAVRSVVGEGVAIVDSAETTARVVEGMLGARNCLNGCTEGSIRFMTTDDAARFARVGGRFLGRDIRPEDVELVDL